MYIFTNHFLLCVDFQANLPTNLTDYRFDDKSDVEDYVTMVAQMRDYFDEALEV